MTDEGHQLEEDALRLAQDARLDEAVQAVLEESKRRERGKPTMTDNEWLALVDRSLK